MLNDNKARGLPLSQWETLARHLAPANSLFVASYFVNPIEAQMFGEEAVGVVRDKLAELLAHTLADKHEVLAFTKRADPLGARYTIQTLVMPLDKLAEVVRAAYERGLRAAHYGMRS